MFRDLSHLRLGAFQDHCIMRDKQEILPIKRSRRNEAKRHTPHNTPDRSAICGDCAWGMSFARSRGPFGGMSCIKGVNATFQQ